MQSKRTNGKSEQRKGHLKTLFTEATAENIPHLAKEFNTKISEGSRTPKSHDQK